MAAFSINANMLETLENGVSNEEENKTAEAKAADEAKAIQDKVDADKNNLPEGTENNNSDEVKVPEGDDADKEKTDKVIPPVVVEPTEEQTLAYLKSKGFEHDSIESFIQSKEEKEESPYASLIEDPEVKAFLDYKKETNRGLNDFLKTQEDVSKISLLDLAVGQAKSDVGGDMIREEYIEFIESELNLDLSDLDSLSSIEKAKLTKYSKEHKAQLIAENEKYKLPLAQEANNAPKEEMITLKDGQVVPKKAYEAHEKIRQTYLQETKVAVDSVAKTTLNVEFDNKGKKESVAVDYEHDAEDKKNMYSLSSDVDKTVKELFQTEKGFDRENFVKSVWRLDPKNWEKEVSAIVNKAIAENTLMMQKNENNVNFSANKLPGNGNSGGKKKDVFEQQNGFAVNFSL